MQRNWLSCISSIPEPKKTITMTWMTGIKSEGILPGLCKTQFKLVFQYKQRHFLWDGLSIQLKHPGSSEKLVTKSSMQLYGVNNSGFTSVQLKANFKGIQILCRNHFMLCWKAVKQRNYSAAQKPTWICMGGLGWQTVITWGRIWPWHWD